MSPSARDGAFEGDLKALSIVELVQTITLGGKTARLSVNSDGRRGELWFNDGVMTHAVAGSLFGDLAVYAMIEWTSGKFLVEYGVSTEASSITQDGTYLVLEGLRRLDERTANGSSPVEPVEVAPILEADALRKHSRRFAFGLIAAGIAAGAIVTAALPNWRSASATDAAAAARPAVAPDAPVGREAAAKRPPAKRSASMRPPPTQTEIVAAPPVAAPESAAAEEPVSAIALLAPQLASDDAPVSIGAADESPRLHISGKSGADGGSLTVLVDGTPAYTHQQLGKREPFQADIVLTPGEHFIVARLEDGARVGVHEDSTRSVFVQGECRLLEITANRTFGSPVKIKLGRLASPTDPDPASLAR